jgi:hypothetical protein
MLSPQSFIACSLLTVQDELINTVQNYPLALSCEPVEQSKSILKGFDRLSPNGIPKKFEGRVNNASKKYRSV